MFIPPRTKRGTGKPCTRTQRMLSTVTVGAVALGTALGTTPLASAEPSASSGRPLVVDIVGDSYLAGDGLEDGYLDPADRRNRSLVSPALQALSRVVTENPGLRVDANIVASSGAVTADYFDAQQGARGVVINPAQHHQVRPNAQVVIVGFGGNDAELARVLSIAKPSNDSTPGDLDAKVKNFGGLLDINASDQTYLDQAASTPLGAAPTLVSRMLQVLGGIANRAPGARIVVTNYPLAVDPDDPRAAALIGKRDLVTVQKFLLDLNETIARAVRICACADLVNLTDALDGHEAFTTDSAYAEPASGQPHQEAVQPNREGAARMADPLATDLATWLGIRSPKPSGGEVTVPKNIAARPGEPDLDGDLVPDHRDEAPGDPKIHRHKHDWGDRSPHRERPRAAHRRPVDRESTEDGLIPVVILSAPPKRKPDRDESAGDGERGHAGDRSPERAAPAVRHGGQRPAGDSEGVAKPEWDVELVVVGVRAPVAEDDGRASVVEEPVDDAPGGFGWFDEGAADEEFGAGRRFVGDEERGVEETPDAEPISEETEGESAEGRFTEAFVVSRWFMKAPDVEAVGEDTVVEETAGGPDAESAPIGERAAEEAPVGESVDEAVDDEMPVERWADGLAGDKAPAGEPVADEVPVDPTADGFAGQKAPADDAVDDEAPSDEPVGEAVAGEDQGERLAGQPVAGEPVVLVPADGEGVAGEAEAVPEQATDGQRICILIYPAPAGCGAPTESEGGRS